MKRISAIVGCLALILSGTSAAAQVYGFGLSIVTIAVKDFQRTTDFYSALGMKAGPRYSPQTAILVWDKGSEGSNILMQAADERAALASPPPDEGPGMPVKKPHLKLGSASFVIQVEDLRASLGKLRTLGFTNIPEPTVVKTTAGSFAVVLIRDPNGNTIELTGPVK